MAKKKGRGQQGAQFSESHANGKGGNATENGPGEGGDWLLQYNGIDPNNPSEKTTFKQKKRGAASSPANLIEGQHPADDLNDSRMSAAVAQRNSQNGSVHSGGVSKRNSSTSTRN